MNQRFILITFAASVFMFAMIFALTAPTPSATPVKNTPQATEMYANCAAVIAAGVAPLRAGQPGYRAALDANMNGVACETVGAPTSASTAASGVTAPTGNQTPIPSDAPSVETPSPPPPTAPQGPSTPSDGVDTSPEKPLTPMM